jgi:hypothetical protein
MDLLGLGALGVVAVEWLGLGWLSGVGWPPPSDAWWLARWALRLLVGATLIALTQTTLALTPAGFGSIPLVLVLAACLAGALRLVPRPPPGLWVHIPLDPDARARAGWLLLGLVLIAAIVRSWVVPEAAWDAFSHWGLRAQAYALAGTVVSANSEHEYYPPLVPLLEAWLYLHRGVISLDLAKTVWALVGSAFAVCLAWHLHLALHARWLAPTASAAIVLATPALIDGFWSGQADLALTVFLTLATLAVVRWQRAPNRMWLVQATLFAGAAGTTKLEGLPRIVVLALAIVLVALAGRQPKPVFVALMLTAAAGATTLLWIVVAARHDISSNSEHLGSFQPLALGAVVVSLVAVFGGVRAGGGLLVAAFTWAVAGRRLLDESVRLLTVAVIGQAAATVLAFLVSDTAPAIEVGTSATRLFEQWLPLALFAGAVALDCYLAAEPGDAHAGILPTDFYNRRGR